MSGLERAWRRKIREYNAEPDFSPALAEIAFGFAFIVLLIVVAAGAVMVLDAAMGAA